MKKQFLVLLLTLLPVLAMADDSGSCGDNVTWTYTESTKTLTIQGSGAIDYYSPWYDFRTNIQNIVIEDGVTSIGDRAFEGCSGLTSVVSEIDTPFAFGSNAFNNISAKCLLTVSYGKKDAYIDQGWTTSVFKGGIVEGPIGNMTFADANVKALCVANWDTNSNGELSEEEAAAVTNLGTVFQGNTTITSFDELQYFTGLSDINVEA